MAENIDLSTVPDRDTVQLTIYNSEDLTLVRETRKVVFWQGNNPLQFSWAGTLIDPTSVQLRFLSHADKLDVLDTTFPHDRPQELTWNVGSEHAGEATIEISYFTSGVTWSADYVVIADADESSASVEGHVTVHNRSGEDYDDAQVRLVVGTINLVEQIAELARRSGRDYENLGRDEIQMMRPRAARQMLGVAEGMVADAAPAAPKQIVKQGLSEYFIFTIEGTEDIPNQMRKRLPSFAAEAVPLRVQYRYRPRQYGDRLARLYLMTNDTASDLGDSPLPDGQARVFRRKAADAPGLSFLARQSIRYIPVGEDFELDLGTDPDVGFELVTRRIYRENVWLRLRGANVFRRVGEPGVAIDDRSTVAGWDQHAVMARRVRNDTPRKIDVEIRQAVPGDATFISRLDAERFDNQTVVYGGTLEPGERYDAVYEVVTRQDRNAKQSRVEIVAGDPGPRK
ncbi:MAG: DUF4139 domain-containing protein [Planctomycetota bacterium]